MGFEAGEWTLFDHILDPTQGFYREFGVLLSGPIQQSNGAALFVKKQLEKCPVPVWEVDSNFSLHYPVNTLFCIIGVITGLLGFIDLLHSSQQRAAKKSESAKTPRRVHNASIALSFSYIFFSAMNISGLLFHSVFPLDILMLEQPSLSMKGTASSSKRVLSLLDCTYTGLSGILCGYALFQLSLAGSNTAIPQSLPSQSSIITKTADLMWCFLLCLFLSLVSIVSSVFYHYSLFSECFYWTGVLAVLISCVIIRMKSTSDMNGNRNNEIGKIVGDIAYNTTVGTVVFTMIVIPLSLALFCESSSILNSLSPLQLSFLVCDIGYLYLWLKTRSIFSQPSLYKQE